MLLKKQIVYEKGTTIEDAQTVIQLEEVENKQYPEVEAEVEQLPQPAESPSRVSLRCIE